MLQFQHFTVSNPVTLLEDNYWATWVKKEMTEVFTVSREERSH